MPVHDSDAVVHALYEGEAVPLIERAFPGATSDGKVDRARLAAMVLGDAKRSPGSKRSCILWSAR